VLVRPLRGDERLTELPQIPPEGATAPALASGARGNGPVRWEMLRSPAKMLVFCCFCWFSWRFHGFFMVFCWFFAGFLLEIEALKVVISMGFHWEFQQHGDLLEILFASNMLIFCGMNGMSPYLTGNGGKPTENLWKHMVEKWDIPDTVNPTKMRIICHKSWVCGQKCRFECQEG
jgi:hypothetical protein